MTTAAPVALKVAAAAHADYSNETRSYTMDYTRPLFVEISTADYATREEAEAAAALFPKSAKFYVSTCSHPGGIYTYTARTRSELTANDNNGGRNETGIRRYRSIMARADKLGAEIEFAAGFVNHYPTRESFESAIAG